LEVNGNIKISGKITQEDWIPASLINGWVNYGDPFNPASYFADKNGVVHLRGLVKNGVIGAPIFNLPVGYRPAGQELHIVASVSGASGDGIGRCDILTNGDVFPRSGINGWFSLDGITFKAK
jgi:hypothetical protein